MLPLVKKTLSRGTWIACIVLRCWGQGQGPAGASFNDRTFDFYHEFYGPRAYTNPEASANFQNRMANGVGLQPPFDSGLIAFVKSRGTRRGSDIPFG